MKERFAKADVALEYQPTISTTEAIVIDIFSDVTGRGSESQRFDR